MSSASTTPPAASEVLTTIGSIQVLRAVAALGVAACHYGLFYSQAAADPGAVKVLAFGEAGVDLFFVISGFIMVYASRPLFGQPHAGMTFLVRRLIRIVPIYWLVTTAYLVVAMAAPQLDKDTAPAFVAASYFFIPYPRSDGSMQPLVGQGWSLNYEMLFYLIFALSLFAPRRIAVASACAAVVVLAAAGYFSDAGNPSIKFWTNQMVVEFALGMAIGLAWLEGVRLPGWLGWICAALGLACFAASAQLHAMLGGRLIPWGIPAAIAVAGGALANLSIPGSIWRGLIIVGEASYALYLSHAAVIRALAAGLRRAGLDMPFWPGLALALVVCVIIAIAMYYAIERPLTRALRRRFDVRRRPPRATQALPI